MGRIHYLQAMKYPYNKIREDGFGLVPIHVDLHYYSPLRFEDDLMIHTAISDLSRASIKMTQQINLNDKKICSA